MSKKVNQNVHLNAEVQKFFKCCFLIYPSIVKPDTKLTMSCDLTKSAFHLQASDFKTNDDFERIECIGLGGGLHVPIEFLLLFKHMNHLKVGFSTVYSVGSFDVGPRKLSFIKHLPNLERLEFDSLRFADDDSLIEPASFGSKCLENPFLTSDDLINLKNIKEFILINFSQ